MSFRSDFDKAVIGSFLQEAAARLEEVKKSIEAKMAFRQSNLNPERPGKTIVVFLY